MKAFSHPCYFLIAVLLHLSDEFKELREHVLETGVRHKQNTFFGRKNWVGLTKMVLKCVCVSYRVKIVDLMFDPILDDDCHAQLYLPHTLTLGEGVGHVVPRSNIQVNLF